MFAVDISIISVFKTDEQTGNLLKDAQATCVFVKEGHQNIMCTVHVVYVL